jgi:tryptophanyl-tRNA synthetase
MARDIAQRFNHLYGEHFTLPEAEIDEAVATLPGLDGRKMSKSYDNTIPLFTPRAQLQKLIGGIVTDSRMPGEPKDTEGSALFQIFQAFADSEETDGLRRQFAEGIGWGDAKQVVFERIDRELAPLRARYEDLLADPARIEGILHAGAEKARALSRPFIGRLRHAVGLRTLGSDTGKGAMKSAKVARPAFKQYRERDGNFYFKLLDGQGDLLLQSLGFATPQEAGKAIGALQAGGASGLPALLAQLEPIDNSRMRTVANALEALARPTSDN